MVAVLCHHRSSLRQTQPRWHRRELASYIVLLLANGVKKQCSAGDVYVEQRHFPILAGDLRLDNLKSTALCEFAENPEPEIDIRD